MADIKLHILLVEENLNAKSLKNLGAADHLPFGVRTSMSDYREQEHLIDLPLNAMSDVWEIGEYFMEQTFMKKCIGRTRTWNGTHLLWK